MNEYLIMLYCISCCRNSCCMQHHCCKKERCAQRIEPPCECEVCHQTPCRCNACEPRFGGGYADDFFGFTSQLFPHIGMIPPHLSATPQPRCQPYPPPPPKCERPCKRGCDEYSRYNPRYRRW